MSSLRRPRKSIQRSRAKTTPYLVLWVKARENRRIRTLLSSASHSKNRDAPEEIAPRIVSLQTVPPTRPFRRREVAGLSTSLQQEAHWRAAGLVPGIELSNCDAVRMNLEVSEPRLFKESRHLAADPTVLHGVCSEGQEASRKV